MKKILLLILNEKGRLLNGTLRLLNSNCLEINSRII